MSKKNKNLAKYRSDLARNLETLIGSLKLAFDSKNAMFQEYPIRDAIKAISDTKLANNPICTYHIDNLLIPIAPQKHIEPQNVDMKYLTFSMQASWKLACMEEELEDPFDSLAIKVEFTPQSPEDSYLHRGYHIDRWSEEDRNDTNEIHPIYHIHFSNESFCTIGDRGFKALSMDTPRLPHYPMDIFLALAEVIGTYNKPAFEKLQYDKNFPKICQYYGKRIAAPYHRMIVSSFSDTRTGYIPGYNPYLM